MPISGVPILSMRGSGAGGVRKSIQDLATGIRISVGKNAKFRAFQRTYRDDRVAFVYDCLPRLRKTFAPYQEEVLANYDIGYRRQCVRGPHGLGKTLIASIIVHHTLLTIEEDAMVPTLASAWRQLEKYLWPEIHKTARLLSWYLIGRDPYTRDELMLTSIRTNNGLSESFAVASDDASLIEGAHASVIFYIFDESKSINRTMWNAAEGAFATEGATMLDGVRSGECYWLAISTPGIEAGQFYEIHARKPGYEDWLVRFVTLEESIAAGRIGTDWVESRKRQWGIHSAVYKNRVLGEFAAENVEGVIPLEWIDAAIERWKEWDEAGRLGKGLGYRHPGVDTARMGDDSSVIADRVDNRVEELLVYTKTTVPVLAGYVRQMAIKASETLIEMDSGIGAGVYDILNNEQDFLNRTMNLVPIYMGAGTSMMDKTGTFRFNSTRSAVWWKFRELLDPDREGGSTIMLPPDDMLIGDLSSPRYEIKFMNGELTICIETKESLHRAERLGRSTDRGDAVVISFWDGESSGGRGVVI